MISFDDYLKEQLKDEEFRKEYEKYEPEIECVRLLTEERKKQNITQKELSKMTGIRQSNLSRIETGICSPTLDTLQKIAVSLGKKLTIQIK
jgi:predicted transcriptional regulator